jgi:hypothetical protein
MNSTGSKTIAEGLQLAPSEERLLRQIVFPDPPGRFKRLFQRPVQGPKDIMLAVLVIAVLIALFWLIGDLIDNLLGIAWFQRFSDMLVFIVLLVVISFRDARMALQERLVRRLYGVLEQRSQESSS